MSNVPSRVRLILAVLVLLWGAPAALAQAQTAHVWVNTTGGSCSRNSSPAAYNQATSCSSFSAAYSVAQGGDTVRIKAGTYGQQTGVGGSKSPVVTFIGENGTQIITAAANSGLHFRGNATVQNVNVGGAFPTIRFDGPDNTWESSRLLASTAYRSSGEPIEIYSDGVTLRNTTLRNVTIEQQKAVAGWHLELIRIDQNVDGVLIDRVTFEACPDGSGFVGCGSGQIFITTPSTTTFDPVNIVIRNSIFKGSPNYGIQIHSNWNCANFTLAYNTFRNEPVLWGCSSRSNVQLIGNVGPRPQNCMSGTVFTKNVWQHSVGSPCGSDTLVIGASFETSALGLDANFRPTAGSRVISAGETSYCRGALGSVDRDGAARPTALPCSAGGYEYGNLAAPPQPPSNLRILSP